MPAKTLGGAIASAGQAVNKRVAGRLGRINDVHRAAVEGHYKAEAQQRNNEHHHATIDKIHKLSGGGQGVRISSTDQYGGSHQVEYTTRERGTSTKKPAESAKPAEPIKAAEPAAAPAKKVPVGRNNTSNNYTGAKGAAASMRRRADARKAADTSVVSPKTSTGVDAPVAKPASKKRPPVQKYPHKPGSMNKFNQ